MSAWAEFEIDLIITDYFEMLKYELNGQHFNKTAHRNKLLKELRKRSKGSIEFKHQNISAVLIKNGLPYIKGYKPRWNYQHLLEEKILKFLGVNLQLEENFESFANRNFKIPKVFFKSWKVTPPTRHSTLINEPKIIYRRPIKKNYLELEQRNQSIGYIGEKLVLEYEKWRLKQAGFLNLVKEVKWISKDIGDGAGFDILSKNASGKDIFIEVKSTTLGKEAPIFFTKTENDFSEEQKHRFYLYRVFDLKDNPKMFNRRGSFKDICSIEAVNFKGYF